MNASFTHVLYVTYIVCNKSNTVHMKVIVNSIKLQRKHLTEYINFFNYSGSDDKRNLQIRGRTVSFRSMYEIRFSVKSTRMAGQGASIP